MISRLIIAWIFIQLPIGQAEELMQPEQEILQISNELSRINTSLNADTKIGMTPGQGTGTADSFYHLQEAGYWFAKGNWLATIRELTRYEAGTQIHTTENLLEFHYLSGKTHTAIAKYAIAIEHYKIFLAESAKKKDIDPEKINDVLASTLECLLKAGRGNSGFNLAPNISAILTSQNGGENSFEAYFLAGRIANMNNNHDLSQEWLDTALKSNSKIITTKSLFFKALLEISTDNLDGAYDLLKKSEETSQDKDLSGYHNQALLALARIEFYRKNYAEAHSWYQKVTEKSRDYQSALNENIHAATAALLYKEAKVLVEKYLRMFPESEENQEIKQFQAYLSLKTEPEKIAGDYYNNEINNLLKLQQEIKDLTIAKEKINEPQLETIMSKVRKIGTVGKLAGKSQNTYKKLTELDEKASFTLGALMEQYNWLAQKPFASILPNEVARAEQYENQINAMIGLGEKIATVTRFVLYDKLSKAEAEALKRNERRRKNLLNPDKYFRRGFENLGLWIRSRALLEKLESLKNTNSKLISRLNPSTDPDDDEIKSAVKNIETRIDQLSSSALLGSAENLSKLSPFLAQEKLLLQYSLAISYDLTQVHSKMQPDGDFANRQLKSELNKLWAAWFNQLTILYDQIRNSQLRLSNSINDQIVELNTLSTKAAEVKTKIVDLRQSLELAVGKSGHLLANQYLMEIQSRIAETRQWMAELNLQKLAKIRAKHESQKNDFELEKQKLSEDYLDSVQIEVPK